MIQGFTRVLICTGLAVALSVANTFAFTPDNSLLSKLYDKVDMVYNTSPERVLHAYHALPYAKIVASNKPEMQYYLEKIEAYIHGKLFTFTKQPNFVCLNSYVQKNDTVEIDYTITNVIDGSLIVTTLESLAREIGIPASQIETTLAFNPGNNQVMPGMDTLVLGSQVNKRVAAVVQPKDAYGVYTESKRVTFTGKLDPIIQLSTEGERVMMQVTVDGETKLLIGTVIEKTAEKTVVDFNHPLAGETVLLSLEVMNLFKGCTK